MWIYFKESEAERWAAKQEFILWWTPVLSALAWIGLLGLRRATREWKNWAPFSWALLVAWLLVFATPLRTFGLLASPPAAIAAIPVGFAVAARKDWGDSAALAFAANVLAFIVAGLYLLSFAMLADD